MLVSKICNLFSIIKVGYFLAGFLLLTVAVVSSLAENNTAQTKTPAPTTAVTTLKPVDSCPSVTELNNVGCLCYPETHYLICDGSSNTLTFTQEYSLKTLVIRNSPNLPFWSEHISEKNHFIVESLIVLQSNENVKMNENFNDLLRLPTKAIKIVTDGRIKTLDLMYMRSDLTSVSVTGVQKLAHGAFTNFNFGDENTLVNLRLRSVGFVPVIENLVLNKLPLKVLEITGSDLKGIVSVVPSKCLPEDEPVVIDLRNNPALTGLSFADLFQNKSTCHYHIDLSDNPNLNPRILVDNFPILQEHGANMFIRIAGVDLVCDCPLINLYKEKLRNNIHSVQCKGEKKKYLDVVASDSDKDKECNPPTTKKPNSS